MNEDKAIKSASWYVISNLFIKALSFITAPIFTHILTPEEYGGVSNFFAWESFVAVFIGFGLDYSIGRAKIDFEENFAKYLSAMQTIVIGAGIVVFAFIFIFYKFFYEITGLSHLLLVLLVLYSVSRVLISFFQSQLRFSYSYKGNIFIAFYTILTSTILSLLFLCVFDVINKTNGRLYGQTLPIIILGMVCFFITLYKGKRIFDVYMWKYALIFSFPMIPHALSMIVLEQIDRIMIVKYQGFEAAGLYSFAYTFATILSVVTNSIMSGWQPWFFENLGTEKIAPINKSVKLLLTTVLIFISVYLCVIPEFMKIMGRKEFWIAKYAAIPVIIGCFFQFLYNIFVQIELYYKKTILIAIGSIFAAIINFLLNFIFIFRYGYVAAGYTTMVCYFLLMLYHIVVCKFCIRKYIFEVKYILLCSLIVFVLSFIYLFLYDNIIWIRYLFCVLFFFSMLLINRKKLKSLFEVIIIRTKNKSRN